MKVPEPVKAPVSVSEKDKLAPVKTQEFVKAPEPVKAPVSVPVKAPVEQL